MHPKISIPALFLFLLLSGAAATAVAAPVELQAIQIRPAEIIAGNHPEISATIKSKVYDETLEVNIVASVTGPDNAVRSWTWKKIVIKAGDTHKFTVPKEYDVTLAGIYKVDFSVFTADMQPLSKGMNRFIVTAPAQPPVKTTAPQPVTGGTGTAAAGAPQQPPVKTTAPKKVTPATGKVSAKKAGKPAEDRSKLALGAYVNTINTAGGATVLYWPFKQVGLQASYSAGYFTTAEGRLLVRFPRPSGFTPYVGLGFASVATERTVDVINITTTFSDTGVSGALGVEMPLRKNVTSYIEISGAAIDLKKEVTDGMVVGTASIGYAPLTVGVSVVFFLF